MTTDRRVVFDAHTERQLTPLLERVRNAIDIGWDFTDSELIVDGLTNSREPVVFTHYKNALCYFDGLLVGFEAGLRRCDHGDYADD